MELQQEFDVQSFFEVVKTKERTVNRNMSNPVSVELLGCGCGKSGIGENSLSFGRAANGTGLGCICGSFLPGVCERLTLGFAALGAGFGRSTGSILPLVADAAAGEQTQTDDGNN